MKAIDLTGKRFNRLTVLERTANNSHGRAMWVCRCDCGNIVTVWGGNLRNGHTQSCGCLQREHASKASRLHGMTKTRIYSVWKQMRQRCLNPNHKRFNDWGGRGITVCREWQDSFEAFYDHVSQLPNFGESGYSLDRINNNGNYEPGNVRWATRKEQRHNRRKDDIDERFENNYKACQGHP